MLAKFEFSEPELMVDDPRLELMQAWAQADGAYNDNFSRISRAISEVDLLALRRQGTGFNKTLALEDRLQTAAPEFMVASVGFKRALDKVRGWHISWRQFVQGQAQSTRLIAHDDELIVAGVVRQPDQYPLNEGWIVGNRVGPDFVHGGVGAWVEVALEPEQQKGMNHPIGTMFAINLSPPKTA